VISNARRDLLLAVAVTFAATALGMWGLGTSAEAASDTAPAADPGRGAALFVTGCSSCHGTRGEGVTTPDGKGRGPSIVASGEAGAYFQLSTGRMPLGNSTATPVRKRPAYGADDIAALVAYVGSLGAGPKLPAVDVANADLASGGQLYLADCAACHSASGAGGALSYGAAAPGLSQAEPLQVATAVRSGPGQMPVFDPDVIDQSELSAVTSYVQYLRHPNDRGGLPIGRIGPVPEGFVALTFGIGSLLAAVAWIGTRSPLRRRAEEEHDA
jgi:ubiquinol-cytochrome c reductase cytochrome c subunit